MEMKEWIFIVIMVIFVLILLDGFRRKLLERKSNLRFKLDKNIPPEDDGFDYDDNHELPNGGARSASEAPFFGRHDNENNDELEETTAEDVPVLTDVIEFEEGAAEVSNASEENSDTAHYKGDSDGVGSYEEDSYEENNDEGNIPSEESVFIDDNERIEPSFGDAPLDSEVMSEEFHKKQTEDESSRKKKKWGSREKKLPEKELQEEIVEEVMVAEDQTELFIDYNESADKAAEKKTQAVQEVIVFNVMAKPGEFFIGKELLPILMDQGMRLGDMSIFHRYGDMSGNGPIMFSMANMVEPGTFNLSQMEEFSTPGISFFLQLPNEIGSMPCFEIMLEAANAVRNGLDGELKDENRNNITHQTLEHSRERIRDFELKQLSGK